MGAPPRPGDQLLGGRGRRPRGQEAEAGRAGQIKMWRFAQEPHIVLAKLQQNFETHVEWRSSPF
eukprot:2862976-Pyramimonas_sp.AAC.1